MRRYALIGDIHSQGRQLSEALKICRERNLTPVFLGDLFDSRTSNSETVYVYHQIRLAQKELDAIVLQSNHQDRLLEILRGTYKNQEQAAETWRTLSELKEAGIDLDNLEEWLADLPTGFVFENSRGKQYRCCHAFFPTDMDGKITSKECFVEPDGQEQRDIMLWGIYTPRRKRVRWWTGQSRRSWVRVAGHYHTVKANENTLVLDANCGFDDGQLAFYDVEAEELILIP